MLFNWRMLEVTGDAKYADIVETALYNSVLSGVSLDGKKYFYTNPLRISADLPYTLRWPKERTEYISCFCCPPNTLRTVCQAQNYAYTVTPNAVYCNLYGANTLATALKEVGKIGLMQETEYPWEGAVKLTVTEAPKPSKKKAFSLFLRVPDWCEKATLIYCLESMDIEGGHKIDNVLIPADIRLTPKKIIIEGSPIVALDGTARLVDEVSWKDTLYREVGKADKPVNIRLIPYYAWGNRGKAEMTVWMPLARTNH